MAVETYDTGADGRGTRGDPCWVTVGEAAERAGVSTSTVRHWYRAGRLATQRTADRGAFLVPAADVALLAAAADAEGDAAADTVIDINAAYWSAETDAARAEAVAAAEEAARLADALDVACARAEQAEAHIDFLRGQLAEAGDGAALAAARIAGLEAQVASLHGELDELRRLRAFASVTDHAWLGEADAGYRGPARPQEVAADEPRPAAPAVEAGGVDDFVPPVPVADEAGRGAARRPQASRPDFGGHADDVLPGGPGGRGGRRR